MNYQQYHDRRKLILSEIVNCDDGTREVLLGELRSLRNKYECDCHHCNEPLLYEHSPQTRTLNDQSNPAGFCGVNSGKSDLNKYRSLKTESKTGDTKDYEDEVHAWRGDVI